MNRLKTWLLNSAIGLDIFCCAFFLGGKDRQTISGWLGVNYPHDFITLAINYVFWYFGLWPDKYHCFDVKTEEEKIFKDENN